MQLHAPRSSSHVTVADLHERSYRQYATRPAVLTDAGSQSYKQLGFQVHQLIEGLRARGMKRGDRGVIVLDNCPEYFQIDQALFVGGFIRVAISPRLHPLEIHHILEDSSATTLFTTAAIAESLRDILHKLPALRLVVTVYGGDLSLEEVRARGTDQAPQLMPRPDEHAALLYTSGTTGRPKGAALSHRNWLAMVRNCMTELPVVTSDDVVLHTAPLSHLSGYAAPVYFVRGAAHLAVQKFHAETVLDLLVRHRVTVLPMVPTILNLLTLAAESRPNVGTSLRSIVYAGSPIAPERLARARAVFGDVFTQFYGLSELPMPLTCLSVEDHRFDSAAGEPPSRLASAGRPNPFVELKVVDSEGDPLPDGSTGEILVRTDTCMTGYWNRPEASEEYFAPEGWAKTGDLGRFDEDGYLYIVDRIKDMIVSGGYNVYPTEVENAISTLDEVREVAVVGVPDETWGEAVCAFIVTREDVDLTEDQVVEACLSRLAAFKKPRTVVFVPELPKTGSGKLKKRELRDRFWTGNRRVGG